MKCLYVQCLGCFSVKTHPFSLMYVAKKDSLKTSIRSWLLKSERLIAFCCLTEQLLCFGSWGMGIIGVLNANTGGSTIGTTAECGGCNIMMSIRANSIAYTPQVMQHIQMSNYDINVKLKE